MAARPQVQALWVSPKKHSQVCQRPCASGLAPEQAVAYLGTRVAVFTGVSVASSRAADKARRMGPPDSPWS